MTLRNSKIVAWLVVPFIFSLCLGIAYRIALSRQFEDFFPTSNLFLTLIAISLISGLASFLSAKPRPPGLVILLYVPAMLAVLLALHAFISCLYGNCF